jgi:predicted dehydrogenase
MSKLKVTIVGCGKIADAHVDQIRATGVAEVVAVCDSELLMAKQLADRFGIAQTFSDIHAMLDQCRPDVVHIATPPDSHVALSKICVDKGAHIFVEKPFANTAKDAQTIYADAKAANRLVSVNHMYCFEDPFIALKEQFDAGKLGSIVHCDAAFGYDLAGDYGVAVLTDENHWVHRLPGKLFHNVLDHIFCKWSPFIDNSPLEVQATAFRQRAAVGRPIIDALPDELRFTVKAGLQTFSGHISAHARPVPHTMRVYGSKNSVSLDFACRTAVPIGRQQYPGSIGRVFPALAQAKDFFGAFTKNANAFRRNDYHFFMGMRRLLSSFYASIQQQTALPLSQEQVLKTCQLIDALVVAIDQNQTQQLREVA